MEDYFVTILKLLNVIHWENKVIVSCLLEKDKSYSVCKSMDKVFDGAIEEFNNKCHSDHAEWPRMSFYWLSEYMKNRLYVSENGTEYEIYDNKIMVEHENGYYGCLCGKSSMSIFKGNKEVLHTGFRNINTPDELYKQLSEMPSFMEMLANIDFDDEEEDDI